MKQNITRFVLAATASLAIAALSAGQTQAQQTTAVIYEGARLITGDGSAPIEDSAFVVETGRFMRIGKRGEVQAPAGATRVDLTGKTVGCRRWTNTHAHLGPLGRDYIDQAQHRVGRGGRCPSRAWAAMRMSRSAFATSSRPMARNC